MGVPAANPQRRLRGSHGDGPVRLKTAHSRAVGADRLHSGVRPRRRRRGGISGSGLRRPADLEFGVPAELRGSGHPGAGAAHLPALPDGRPSLDGRHHRPNHRSGLHRLLPDRRHPSLFAAREGHSQAPRAHFRATGRRLRIQPPSDHDLGHRGAHQGQVRHSPHHQGRGGGRGCRPLRRVGRRLRLRLQPRRPPARPHPRLRGRPAGGGRRSRRRGARAGRWRLHARRRHREGPLPGRHRCRPRTPGGPGACGGRRSGRAADARTARKRDPDHLGAAGHRRRQEPQPRPAGTGDPHG